MRKNHVKEQLRSGAASYGLWLSIPNTMTAKMLAHAGFDWLLVDFEHTPSNPTVVAEMLNVIADANGAAPLMRLPFNSVEYFKWGLDSGAWGVMVPMVNTRAEAEQAVRWAKYPPVGERSIGGIYAPYSFQTTRQEYVAQANEQTMVIVQIESKTALENVDEILSVPGVDVAFVGPNDLSASLGLTPHSESQEPRFLEALETIKAAGRRHNVPLGIWCSDGKVAAARVAEGFQFVSCCNDASSLAGGALQHLQTAKG